MHESVQNQSQPVGEVLLSKCLVRFGARMLLALFVLLSEWCVQFGAGMLVPLECRCKVLVQGASCCHNAGCSLEWACWCRWTVLLEGALELAWLACWWWCRGYTWRCKGACVGCCCTLLQGTAKRVVDALELVRWCRCRVVLQGAASGCCS